MRSKKSADSSLDGDCAPARRISPQVPDWRPAFLSAYVEHGKYGRACREAGVHPQTAWRARKEDAEFDAKYREAVELATEGLRDEAHRRAVDGLKRYKFTGKGDPIINPETGQQYFEHEYSDMLLAKMLEARAPEYRPTDAAATISVHLTLDDMRAKIADSLACAEAKLLKEPNPNP